VNQREMIPADTSFIPRARTELIRVFSRLECRFCARVAENESAKALRRMNSKPLADLSAHGEAAE